MIAKIMELPMILNDAAKIFAFSPVCQTSPVIFSEVRAHLVERRARARHEHQPHRVAAHLRRHEHRRVQPRNVRRGGSAQTGFGACRRALSR